MGRQGLRPCTCSSAGRWPATATATPRTPASPHPDRFRRSGRSTPCVDESPLKSNISTMERRASTHGVDLRVDQGRHPPAGHPIPTDRGELSKAGWVRLRGVSRMDAATEPTGTYLRRPRQPDPPPPTGNPLGLLLLLCVACRHAGAGRSPADTNLLGSSDLLFDVGGGHRARNVCASLPCGSMRCVSGRPRGVAKSAGGSNGSTITIG